MNRINLIPGYIVTSWRYFKKNPVYPLVSLFCMMISTTLVVLTFVFVKSELSYDSFHQKSDQIYRVASHFSGNDMEMKMPTVRAPVGPAFLENFPEIQSMVRISQERNGYTFYPKKEGIRENVIFSDSTLFQIFDFRLISGIQESCLSKENAMVITRNTALNWYGNLDVLGKTVRANTDEIYEITGIVEDPPQNSHIKFKVILPLAILLSDPGIYKQWDGGMSAFTYFLLKKGADPVQLEKKFIPLMWEKVNQKYSTVGFSETLYLQSLKSIHLYSDTDNDFEPKGNKRSLVVLVLISLAVLVLSSINFFNLSAILSTSRIKDISVRRISGARNLELILYYIIETSCIAFIAVLLGVTLAEMILPTFNSLVSASLKIPYNFEFLAISFLAALIPAVFIGIATAIRFIRIGPASGLIAGIKLQRERSGIRNVLMVFQFAISILLFICMFVMSEQVKYLIEKDLGFNTRNLMAIRLPSNLNSNGFYFRDQLREVTGVRSASLVTGLPGFGASMNGYRPEGNSQASIFSVYGIDRYFLEALNIPLLSGRMIDDQNQADHMSFLVNEEMVRALGWEDPIGKTIERNGRHTVVGVVKDFHFNSLYERIGPLILAAQPNADAGQFCFALVSFQTDEFSNTLEAVRSLFEKESQAEPFDPIFLDKHFAALYQKETHIKMLFQWFTILSFLISALGLFSMSSVVITSRTKEIGIRKINGAGVKTIFNMLIYDTQKKVILAYCIAAPLAWYFMDRWLQTFVYKTEIHPWVFVQAFLFVIALAGITIFVQCYRASRKNPVDTLRYE